MEPGKISAQHGPFQGGGHIIFVGEVTDFTHWDRLPLLFHGDQYGQIAKAGSTPAGNSEREFETSLGSLLALSTQGLLRPLQEELGTRKPSMAQYFTLAALARYGARSLDALLELRAQGDNAPGGDEIEDLYRRGLIKNSHAEIDLTAAGSRYPMELVAF